MSQMESAERGIEFQIPPRYAPASELSHMPKLLYLMRQPHEIGVIS